MGKNIGILSTSYLPIQGGVQYLLYWLLKEIDLNFESYQSKYGFENIYLIVPEYKNSEFDQFINIKVLYISQSNGKLNVIRNAVLVHKLILEKRIALIHAHHALTDGVLVFLSTLVNDTNYVITSHGIDFAYNKYFNYGERLSYFKGLLIRLVAFQSQRVTTVSNDMVKYVSELVPPRKVLMIENCYEANGETFDSGVVFEKVCDLRKKFSIGSDDTVFLTLSGARAIKGHLNMLAAFADAIKKCPDLKMFIAAHGQETENLKNEVLENGLHDNVFFVGFVMGLEKQAFFEIADVYVNTAFFEPFGLVYLEAIQNDLVVLGSIYGGGKDIFQHLVSAYLSDPYELSSITEGFLYLRSRENRESLMKNSTPLLEHYSVDKILNKYFKLYRELLK